MRMDWKVFLLLGIIISIAVGFLYGTGLLGGDSGSPGSSTDPLITQSYADGAISRRVSEMDTRISELEGKIQSLENEIILLTGGTIEPDTSGAASAPAGGSTGNGGGATGTGGGSTASQANVGKTANVTAEVVNLRESASTSSNIKQRLTPSDTFTITKVDNGWYQVQLSDGTVGWVADYLVRVN